MRSGAARWLFVAFAVTSACAKAEPSQTEPPPDPPVDAGEDTNVVVEDTADVGADTADAADATPAPCVCCGSPFAAPMAGVHPTKVLTTRMGELIAAGNVSTSASVGPLWLTRIGEGGATGWTQTYADERGVLTATVETTDGRLVMLRTGGSGNLGARVVAAKADGTFDWAKTLGADKTDPAATAVAATPKGLVVVGGFVQPTPLAYRGWVVRLDQDGTVLSESIDTTVARWTGVAASPRGTVAMCGSNDGTICAVENEDGTPIWRGKLPLTWMPLQFALTEDGNLYVAGVKQTEVVPDVIPGHVMIAQFDATGAKMWEVEKTTTKRAEVSVLSLIATRDRGFALHGYLTDLTTPTPAIKSYFYGILGDSAGAITWAKGYAPSGAPGGQGQAIAQCKEGMILVGAAFTSSGGGSTWVLHTNAKGEVPITAPGTVVDL